MGSLLFLFFLFFFMGSNGIRLCDLDRTPCLDMVSQKLPGTDVNTLLLSNFSEQTTRMFCKITMIFLFLKELKKGQETILDALLTVSILIATSPPPHTTSYGIPISEPLCSVEGGRLCIP